MTGLAIVGDESDTWDLPRHWIGPPRDKEREQQTFGFRLTAAGRNTVILSHALIFLFKTRVQTDLTSHSSNSIVSVVFLFYILTLYFISYFDSSS